MSSSTRIQQHLDMAATQGGYLDAINGTSPESLIDAEQKMVPFWEAIDYQTDKPVLSVGVGQGEELHALLSTNPKANVIGIDIAGSTLERAQQRLDQHGLGARLIQGDARTMPFAPGIFGGVVMSAVMHEIYSYNQPNGHVALRDAIGGVATQLASGGVLYVREFVSPPTQAGLRLYPSSTEAKAFTEYFRKEFRVGLDEGEPQGLQTRTNGTESAGSIMQVLMHFRNHWNDVSKSHIDFGDKGWKELYESYAIPDPINPSEYLDAHQLCDHIIAGAAADEQRLVLSSFSLIPRRKINMFLTRHFEITDANGDVITPTFLSSATSKLEATFLKQAD